MLINYELPNNSRVKEEITMEIRTYLEVNVLKIY